jgi:hypothetical protein
MEPQRPARSCFKPSVRPCKARLDRNPDKDARTPPDCRASIRHDKVVDGSDALQMKTLKNVSTEMALHVPAYNMKRAMSILGVGGLIEAIRA